MKGVEIMRTISDILYGRARERERDGTHTNDNTLSVVFVHESREHRQQLKANMVSGLWKILACLLIVDASLQESRLFHN